MHNFHRLATHLIPFPSMHFMTMNLAPYSVPNIPQKQDANVILNSALAADPIGGTFCAATFLRGNFPATLCRMIPKEVSISIMNIR